MYTPFGSYITFLHAVNVLSMPNNHESRDRSAAMTSIIEVPLFAAMGIFFSCFLPLACKVSIQGRENVASSIYPESCSYQIEVLSGLSSKFNKAQVVKLKRGRIDR